MSNSLRFIPHLLIWASNSKYSNFDDGQLFRITSHITRFDFTNRMSTFNTYSPVPKVILKNVERKTNEPVGATIVLYILICQEVNNVREQRKQDALKKM